MIELIEHGADVNFVSEAEKRTQTPLFRARNYQAVKLLLQKGADPNLYSTVGSNGKFKAVEHLLENNQDAARAIFDENLNVDDEENLIMDFEIFENEYSDKTDGEMSILVKAEKKSSLDIDDEKMKRFLILHPLVQIFLNLKFKTILWQFRLLFLFQIVLVITLTLIGVQYLQFTACETITENGTDFTNRYFQTLNITIDSQDNPLKCMKNIIVSTDEKFALTHICEAYYGPQNMASRTSIGKCWTTDWLTIFTMFILMIHFIKEMFEFCSKQTFLSYFMSLENLVELVIFLLGWVFLIASNYDIEMAYHASAWMIFWAWINLLLYMGRLNLIGKYIFMSLHVIKILCLCLFAYLPVFFAFTFGYYILLQANGNFNGYVRGFLSVLAMMVDEIGYRLFIFSSYLFRTNFFTTRYFLDFRAFL